MNNSPLYVAILWHMHQPYYKDLRVQAGNQPRTGEYHMPWVRLHGTKDYLDMALVVEEFPEVRVTFNLVPSLVEQIEDYANNDAADELLRLSLKPADALTEEEKVRIVQHLFQGNYETMIHPIPRYDQFYSRCCWARSTQEMHWLARSFTVQEFRDIQVLFNLVWIDPLLRSKDAFLSALEKKGREFSEEEKQGVLEKQREILRRIVPTYRRLWEQGQIELTTSPYFHPILPLLIDTDVAREADPQSRVPSPPFRHPEDAEAQVRQAVEQHEHWFGRRPRGMWPSEGSVSEELIPLLARHGITWIATDEEVLARSRPSPEMEIGAGQGQTGTVGPLKRDVSGHLSPESAAKLYRPYSVRHGDETLHIFFRDQFLSDLIGFHYAHWKGEDAAEDLVERLLSIRLALSNLPRSSRETLAEAASPHDGTGADLPHIVSIILDGENCWENYAEDGLPFLRKLYSLLSDSKDLKTITFGDFCEKLSSGQASCAQAPTLERLHPGSWINANFSIWIGHQEDIESWEYLTRTREDVMRAIAGRGDALSPEQRAQALKALYAAEGSDWNWWYGDEHSSGQDEEFDTLYREHLKNAYRAVGLEPSLHLDVPIVSAGEIGTLIAPRGFIEPVIDGKITSYYEWFSAGVYRSRVSGGAMHPASQAVGLAQPFIRALYYGFDLSADKASLGNFYLRIDPLVPLTPPTPGMGILFRILLLNKAIWKIEISLPPSGDAEHDGAQNSLRARCYTHESEGEWRLRFESDRVALGRILEMALPLPALGLSPHDKFFLQIIAVLDGREIERAPIRNPVQIEVPGEDFEKEFWIV
jgi:alpha-amylase/alpha-mannosidase (GH57 family)